MSSTAEAPKRRPWLSRLLLVGLGVLLALTGAEILLRVYASTPFYYPWPPLLRRVFQPASEVLPGIVGASRFETNADGIRGDPIPDGSAYEILAVGGSTTECLYLDQDEAWPQLLQEKLDPVYPTWVGNVGRSGLRAREHVVQVKYLLRQHSDIDAVVLLVGQNDLINRLMAQDQYDPNFMQRPGAEELLIRRAFSRVDGFESGLALYYHVDRALGRLLTRPHPGEVMDNAGRVVETWRRRRQEGKRLDRLPDLTSVLTDYRRNLETIADLAAAHTVRLVLMTQPAMWRADLSAAERALLQSGGAGMFRQEQVEYYYTETALEHGLDAFNAVLRDVARQRGLDCVDLVPRLPRDPTVFYDDVHFNENGSRRVAEILAEALLQSPPYLD